MLLLSRRSLLVFLCVSLLFLLVTMPARIVGYWVAPTMHLTGFSGSLWRGEAVRLTIDVSGKPIHLGTVSWSLHPGSLLLLSPKVTFSSRWGTQYVSGQVTAGLSGLSVRDVNGRMNVRFIRDLVPLYVGGVLELQDLTATIDGGRSASFESASGRLLWQDAVWTAHTGDVALGRYAVDVGSDGEGVTATLGTLSGPLQLDGLLRLKGERYALDVALRGPAVANEAFQQSVALLATPVDGGFDLRLEGDW